MQEHSTMVEQEAEAIAANEEQDEQQKLADEQQKQADELQKQADEQQKLADELYRIRHSTAHVMAQAVVERYPDAKVGIGPPIQDGFYYDFDLGLGDDGRPRTFTPDDLEAIEARMREIVKGKWPYEVREVTAAEAEELFADEQYKLELIRDLAAGNVDEYGEPVDEPVPITLYTQDTFTDLCRGPHVRHTGYIKPNGFKLLSTAAAYWRGDERNPMLQRIYGTAWKNKTSLEKYLERLEEIEKRDHRRIGTDLDLFSTEPDQVGGGLVLWHAKGGLMRHLIEEYAKERHLEGGYDFVYTPHIGRGQLWETSGHLDFFREGMYAPLDIDGQEYFLKPMNCPFHIMIYKSRRRSYRELPMKMAEWGTVYRYERSGVLHGLMRVRGFTQDDAHIFCVPEDVDASIAEVLNFSLDMLGAFGFDDFTMYVSTRPEKAVGDAADWDRATQALVRAVEARGLDYEMNEGEGAFYGPKIDIDIQDALGRAWQCSTIQFDFNLPERFGLTFADSDGELRRPYMVHRTLFGSMERFFGVLIEHYGGAFPVWLCPVQAVVIPIADRHVEYAEQVVDRLKAAGLRAEVDGRDDRMRAKIRDAQLAKTPYMLVVGDREAESDAVSVRLRTEADLGAEPVDDFIERVKRAIDARTGVEGE
jgi:threonyl-tRNA synthetase